MFNPSHYGTAIHTAKLCALSDYPNETCGAILKDGCYVRFKNVAENPKISFNCGQERAPYLVSDQIVAMVHSHPYENKKFIGELPKDFGPSKHDMIQQLADNIPWGIIATNGEIASECVFWGDGIPEVPLLKRQFRHGPTGTDGRGDCYALIKDYYKQKLNIELPEGPRNFDWWHDDENLYLENMERAGFRTIPQTDVKPGDVFFAQLVSGVPNHGGVLLEGGLIMHHLSGRLSCTDSLLRWRKHIVRWIRHERLDE